MTNANRNYEQPYNENGKEYNNGTGLSQEKVDLLASVVANCGFIQLEEAVRSGDLDGEPADWAEMPSVGWEYQVSMTGDRVKVDQVEDLDVMATEGEEDPAVSFDEVIKPGDDDDRFDDIDSLS